MRAFRCGKVTEPFHLPVALTCPEVRVSAFVDPDTTRAQRLAEGALGILLMATPKGIAEHADAGIVAAPHHLHADLTYALLEQVAPSWWRSRWRSTWLRVTG